MTLDDMLSLLPELRLLAQEAGAATLPYFRNEGTAIIEKQDGSPVTLADRAAEDLILAGLARHTPDIPVIAEESVAAGRIPSLEGESLFWLVDPLDGTKDFISGSGDYTVNIALLKNRQPVLGVINLPVRGITYWGVVGSGAWMAEHPREGRSTVKIRRRVRSGAWEEQPDAQAQVINVRPPPPEGLTVVASRRHGDPAQLEAFISNFTIAQIINRSSSLKFCELAAGRADLYPRLGPTCEWDIAAGHAILRAAGGDVCQIDGTPLAYGKAQTRFLNPAFVAYATRPDAFS